MSNPRNRIHELDLPEGCIECFLGLTSVMTRSWAISIIYKMSWQMFSIEGLCFLAQVNTLILDVGTSTSATLLRSIGSTFRHCKEEVPMARSHSNLDSSE